MTPRMLLKLAVDPALGLLRQEMCGDAARAMMVAIALQESRIKHRRQINGPARGFWQFETAGVRGVLYHQATRSSVVRVAETLELAPTVLGLHSAVEFNDVLAAALARLNLWWLPVPLPDRADPEDGWNQYAEAWRPGKSHRGTWDGLYFEAWEAVTSQPPSDKPEV